MEKHGNCLCGAVKFVAKGLSEKVSACHCGMCRRWAGSPWMGATPASVEWEGEENLGVYQSSPWAERGFCKACGSALFYRITAEGKHQGMTSLSVGAFADADGLTFTREWFIDKKPSFYAFAGDDRQQITEAEVFAMFGG